MVITLDGAVHDVKYYNDDTGYGETACGNLVGPWDVTLAGPFDCTKCRESAS